jgi:mono/diheme cytochrome c family protein
VNQLKYLIQACAILIALFILTGLAAKFFPTSRFSDAVKSDDHEIVVLPKKELSTAELRGQVLFKKNCNMCHGVGRTDDLLVGFETRGPWVNRNELHKWIRNPQEYVLKDSTGYTARLVEIYGVKMTPSPNLSDADIDKILDYLAFVYAQP